MRLSQFRELENEAGVSVFVFFTRRREGGFLIGMTGCNNHTGFLAFCRCVFSVHVFIFRGGGDRCDVDTQICVQRWHDVIVIVWR